MSYSITYCLHFKNRIEMTTQTPLYLSGLQIDIWIFHTLKINTFFLVGFAPPPPLPAELDPNSNATIVDSEKVAYMHKYKFI